VVLYFGTLSDGLYVLFLKSLHHFDHFEI